MSRHMQRLKLAGIVTDRREAQWVRYRKRADFIQRYVFPGGMLASEARLREETARAGLGWGPRWSLGETLEGIVAWHRAWLSGADMHDHCNAELERFVRTPLAHAA
jgi:CDP-glucose 4,6-dehydratase